ncbi:sugar ABC transporter permease [Dictyobacter sp. S3.2.2.5]|uniref:Sugar ABC transporter permease n=1 Tax=Dictyobacter halimunensis TaxID=3026934 RepID=A0ABQ6G331_9CHLR|nr:sugar ABC transporter permease [Dictyobacter sp. S3.2.2.5]
MATTANSRAKSQRPGADMRRQRQINTIWQRTLIYIVLIFIALLIILPLLWMLSTSLKPKAEWFLQQIYWIPKRFTWKNYTDLFNNPDTPIGRWFVNSLGIAAVSTVLTLFLDALAAYAYARLEFVGRKTLFTILLATLFMPGLMFLIPNFLTIYNLGLLNSYAGVILPGLAGVFGVFFLSQFFQSIPKELEEAAQIDGATTFQTFYQIVLPLSKPALATLAVITFLASWNDFLWPLLVLQDPNMYTLPPGLSTLQSSYVTLYGPTMAAAVIVAIPVLIIYVALQRFIVQSVANTGLKG